MLVARKPSCCVANVLSTGLKETGPRSSLKIAKMSKKTHFLEKGSKSQWVKTLEKKNKQLHDTSLLKRVQSSHCYGKVMKGTNPGFAQNIATSVA